MSRPHFCASSSDAYENFSILEFRCAAPHAQGLHSGTRHTDTRIEPRNAYGFTYAIVFSLHTGRKRKDAAIEHRSSIIWRWVMASKHAAPSGSIGYGAASGERICMLELSHSFTSRLRVPAQSSSLLPRADAVGHGPEGICGWLQLHAAAVG